MRIGVVILPEHRWASAQSLWREAEELGFDHAWTYDHLAWRSLRDEPWFGSIPTLTAAAVVTSSIRLGTLVASPNFRHPVPFAKELMTLDDVSGGRLTVGLGAGGGGWDASMLGHEPWPARERAERFAEFVELLDQLLREPRASSRGRFYSADEARSLPGCVQRPRAPFAIAASGPRGMRLAAAHAQTWVTIGDLGGDGVLSTDEGVRVVRDQLGRLEEACAEVGRDPQSLARLVLSGPRLDGGLASADEFAEVEARYAELGVTDYVVHWPRPSDPYAGDLKTFERIFSERAQARSRPRAG